MSKRSISILLFLSLLNICCAKKHQEKLPSYTMPTLGAEEIVEYINSTESEYTILYSYSKMCPACTRFLQEIHDFANAHNIQFKILLTNRAIDTIQTLETITEAHHIDSTLRFNNFIMLSDSLYDIQYRYLPAQTAKSNKKLISFVHYGGPIEGNKYINFIEKNVPETFSRIPATPKLLLYKQKEGLVYVADPSDKSYFLSSDDKSKILDLLKK